MAKKEEKRENAARKKAAFSLRRSGVSRRLRARRSPQTKRAESECASCRMGPRRNGEWKIDNGEWRRRGRVFLPAASGSWECVPAIPQSPVGRQLLLRCPKFFVRIRSQNFDRSHSLASLPLPPAALGSLPPLHKGAFGPAGDGGRRTGERAAT